jgi:uncharacterized HAD superfamily protein
MSKPKLAVDLDGCVYDWHTALYNELFIHNKVTCDQYTFWHEEYKKYNNMFWENMIRVDFLYSTQIPSKETLETLDKLDKCYEIFYVTARPDEMRLVTESYLARYEFPQKENLYFTSQKGLFCNAHNIQIAVEDQVKHVCSLLANEIKVIAMRQPYNEDQLPLLNIPIIASFSEVEKYLL